MTCQSGFIESSDAREAAEWASVLRANIADMDREEVCVALNAGTFSAAECCRKTGCGDSRYGEYEIYERLATGERRVVGCDPDRAPGYARTMDVRAARGEWRVRRRRASADLARAEKMAREIAANLGQLMPQHVLRYLMELDAIGAR